jgi:hypothetical protein
MKEKDGDIAHPGGIKSRKNTQFWPNSVIRHGYPSRYALHLLGPLKFRPNCLSGLCTSANFVHQAQAQPQAG